MQIRLFQQGLLETITNGESIVIQTPTGAGKTHTALASLYAELPQSDYEALTPAKLLMAMISDLHHTQIYGLTVPDNQAQTPDDDLLTALLGTKG